MPLLQLLTSSATPSRPKKQPGTLSAPSDVSWHRKRRRRDRLWHAIKRHWAAPLPSVTGSQSQITALERVPSNGYSFSRTRTKRTAELDPADLDTSDAACNVVVVDRNFNDRLLDPRERARERHDAASGPSDLGHFLGLDSTPTTRPNTGQTSRSGVYTSTTATAAKLRMVKDSPLYLFLRWRMVGTVFHFFHSVFPDPEKERIYIRDTWSSGKPAALAASVFLLITTAMLLVSLQQPYTLYQKILYFGVGIASVLPLFPLVVLNWPQKRPWVWQAFLVVGVWTYPYISLFDFWYCNFESSNYCRGRKFTTFFYYSLAYPVFGLFMLRASRIAEALGALGWIIISAIFILPKRASFVRHLVNFLLFHIAILYAKYLRERANRKMFSLREQLKQQYKATQKAQAAERQASQSKIRFISYIFHEVRVPLNTACLSYQSMESDKVFARLPRDQWELVAGLSSSLATMEKVLNDVLDFNRMEVGKLTWTTKPFDIHATFRTVLMAFRGVVGARNIELVTEFDEAIDAFSPLLLGDEMRLGQVISNLTSNACKFTQDSTVKVTTKLLYPAPPVPTQPHSASLEPREKLAHSTRQPSLAEVLSAGPPIETQGSLRQDIAIVRIEIIDSGVGIPFQDLANNRLFSPYVQTDVGRRQGGKGSGLGLALVRKIVAASGGRLGVTSVLGKGSTFWLELPFRKPGATDLLAAAPASGSSVISAAIPPKDNANKTLESAGTLLNIPSQDPMPASQEDQPSSLEEVFALDVLVVDDDPLTRKLLHRLLSKLGCQVTPAANGQEALDILLGINGAPPKRFDMISLDNSMPVLGGPDTVRRLRKEGRTDFVVGATGNALRADQQLFMEAGADQILTKPVLLKNLKGALLTATQR